MGIPEIQFSRRRFMAGAGALIIGAWLPAKTVRAAASNAITGISPSGDKGEQFSANAFVQIGTDSIVTVLSKHTEVGQGIYTGMATLIAEELDADWSNVKVIAAPVDTSVYKNLRMGIQGTGGSSAVANAWEQMRQMGAMARLMLLNAAALIWQVPASELSVEKGVIHHALSGRSGPFGEFVTRASQLPSPGLSDISLKSPGDFKLIGKVNGPHRIDSQAKTNGSAYFSQDIYEKDMLTVTIKKPPYFGAKLKSFDARESLEIPEVVAVKSIGTGVAVYALSSWAAIRGRDKLKTVWDDSAAEKRSTDALFAEFREKAKIPGTVAAQHGHPDDAFKNADKIIEAEYTFPWLAHAPMEPLAAWIYWDGESVHTKYGCQIQTLDQKQFCEYFNLPPEQVHIETILAGGSFGRRIDLGNNINGPDLAADLSAAAKAIGPGHAIKLISTREDDITGGWYRPMMLHRLRAAIKDNKILAWTNTVAGQSFTVNSAFAAMVKNGVDRTMVEGSKELPYTFPNFRCDAHIVPSLIPVTSLRSVGSTHTGHAVESFIDQLLHETGQDPVEGRLALMKDAPREAGVLRAVAKAANWTGSVGTDGRMRGVGVAKAFGTRVAQIAEVSIGPGGVPKVHKVWCAVDCGIAVNPDVIKAQIEGGIGYGLSIALYGNISMKEGRIEQTNFNSYRPLRINEMPEIEVVIVPSTEAPSGVGELGVPTIAPAVGNALALLGRPRNTLSLPFHRTGTAEPEQSEA